MLYDERGTGPQLEAIADKLRANGYPDVRILAAGFADYAAAEEPTQAASTEQIVPPSKPPET